MDFFRFPVAEIGAKSRKPRQVFTPGEDRTLCELVRRFGEDSWRTIGSQMVGRSGRQCRDRWREYLSPGLTNAEWRIEEDETLISEYAKYGPRWALIANALKGRSAVIVKNRWKFLQRRDETVESSLKKELPPMEEPKTNSVREKLPVPAEMTLTAPHDLEAFFRSLSSPITIQTQYIAKRDHS
jgi:hypothetical protein